MANNYTSASVMVPATAEQAAFLAARLNAEDGDGLTASCRVEVEPDGVWLSGESFDVERVASDICAMLEHFDSDAIVWLEWANTCSKFRLGEFSGGGVRISKGGLDWFVPHAMYSAKYPAE